MPKITAKAKKYVRCITWKREKKVFAETTLITTL